ncbi:MAG: hypothetical protein NT120_00835 [Candidatus Aenigmarchaeota archaeon]|nr:hypothetical protein [Candidatus Aenigmarchaeota archaeon]
MKKEDHKVLSGYAIFLVGLVFLIESVVLAYVVSQLPVQIIGPTAPVAWGYTAVKFLAGVVGLYYGLETIRA